MPKSNEWQISFVPTPNSIRGWDSKNRREFLARDRQSSAAYAKTVSPPFVRINAREMENAITIQRNII